MVANVRSPPRSPMAYSNDLGVIPELVDDRVLAEG